MDTRELNSAEKTIIEACEQLLANNDDRLSRGAVSKDYYRRVCTEVTALRASLNFVIALLESE
ncbi:MAG: hypothetical protein LUF68_01890 [Clostridiales bacterium]|nr:hypothetical protein [Clostridiales bacterium]